MNMNYSYPTTMYESILAQMHVSLVLFTIFAFYHIINLKPKLQKKYFLPKICTFGGGDTFILCNRITVVHVYMSLVMRKPDFSICENKDADQFRGNREADQRLCFRYTDSSIPLLPNCEFSSLQPFSVAVQPGLCRTWSETPKTGFLRTRLIYLHLKIQILK